MPPPPSHAIFDEYPEVDEGSCLLLGPTALVVQTLLGILVILSLVYKRHREDPKRPWRIWLFDVAKQLAGQMFVHGMNLLISGVIANIASANACVFYFLNILIDTTLGVAIIYFLLKSFTFLLTQKFNFEGFISGQYGSPPSSLYWMRQTAVYVLCLTLMKLFVIALFALWPGIFKIGEWLLSWLGDGGNAQVVFVMGIFPIIMNVLQFWLIDSIVKADNQTSPFTLPPSTISQDQEPLFRTSVSDDGDDGILSQSKADIEDPQTCMESQDPDPALVVKSTTVESKTSSTSSTSTTPLPRFRLTTLPPRSRHPNLHLSPYLQINRK